MVIAEDEIVDRFQLKSVIVFVKIRTGGVIDPEVALDEFWRFSRTAL